jgi:hypothetical protein
MITHTIDTTNSAGSSPCTPEAHHRTGWENQNQTDAALENTLDNGPGIVLESLGMKKVEAWVTTGTATARKKEKSRDRQQRFVEKRAAAGLVKEWVPIEVVEAIKSGATLIPANSKSVVPEDIALLMGSNGWDAIRQAVETADRIQRLPRFARWMLRL